MAVGHFPKSNWGLREVGRYGGGCVRARGKNLSGEMNGAWNIYQIGASASKLGSSSLTALTSPELPLSPETQASVVKAFPLPRRMAVGPSVHT